MLQAGVIGHLAFIQVRNPNVLVKRMCPAMLHTAHISTFRIWADAKSLRQGASQFPEEVVSAPVSFWGNIQIEN